MHWLQSVDLSLFKFINVGLSNPVFDRVMPFLSGNRWFFPILVAGSVLLLWKGRRKGFVCLLMLALIVSVGDGFICRNLKNAIERERPCWAVDGAKCLVGKSHSGSMPSSHAANWFAATMVAFLYYRRSIWFTLPLALLVSFSRVYNGVHYPSDVLAGAILGAGYAVALMWGFNALWQGIGKNWFPLWWRKLPSLLHCAPSADAALNGQKAANAAMIDAHWLRLGYLFIVALLFARLVYLASGTIQLAEDEAYQWIWSKHLALSYYSKPPLIAYTQFLGTKLWGDTEFGVRFFSPILSAILGFLILRFFAREFNARAGFFLLLIVTAAPLLAVGSILMTIDPLSVLYWAAAMLSGWRAVQEGSPLRYWFWTGLWMGLGFLSKYTELFQWLCWAVFFALWPPARKLLRTPGPYLALLVNLLCATPVLIWNGQHHWVTARHVAENGAMGAVWHPTLKYLGDFLGIQAGLLNPIFFAGMVWAAIAFWRHYRNDARFIYLFSMGTPLFICYLLYTFHSRVMPNWIAPSIVPLFCLMVAYWDMRWKSGIQVKPWLVTGLVLGFAMVIIGHNTDLVKKFTGKYLPAKIDPLHRVRGWSELAKITGEVRQELMTEGKPVFVIGDHYGFVGQITFYLPEAKAAVTKTPIVYYQSSDRPRNQFYFWPGYKDRKGENAVFIHELDPGEPKLKSPPARLNQEFESVQDLGVRNLMYHGRVLRGLQFFACRNLK